MAYKITEDCIGCGACLAECKNDAIDQGDQYTIDPDKCTECAGWFDTSKCAEVCPVDACVLDPDHEETHDQLIEKWRKLHPGETPEVS